MRIISQPAWIIHRWPYRNTSRLLDVFSRDHGRVRIIALGQKRRRGVTLQAFQAVNLSWIQYNELGTLTGAEETELPLLLTGERLWCGWYLNELMTYLLPHQESCPLLFAAYRQALIHLTTPAHPEPALRIFEKHLLSELGYGLCLDREALTDQPVVATRWYRYLTDVGLVPADKTQQGILLAGSDALALHQEHLQPHHYATIKKLLQGTLAVYLQGRPLQSRRLLMAYRQRRQATRQALSVVQ